MNPERAQAMGVREQLKMDLARLAASIDGLRSTIRQKLNPYTEIEKIDAVILHNQTYELCEKIQKYKEIKLRIDTISDDLGDTGGLHG